MVVPNRDTGNITFHTSTFQTIAKNMASELDIDMANRFYVDNIIFGDSGEREQVRGYSLTSSNTRNRSNISSIKLDSGDKFYYNKVQQESDNMVEDEPIIMLDSSQLKYTTSPRKTPGISKMANVNPNMRQKCGRNITPISSQNIMNNNEDVFNIQLNYNINQVTDLEL